MRHRRGLSTVVGAVFFVIATTTVITYVSYSMNSIDNFSQSVIVSESENIDRGREEIEISQATIVGGKFNMTVTNTGSLPVHLTRLWVTNQDGVTYDKKADLDIRINPGNEQYNIGQNTTISADPTASYILKAVTERGNISTFQVSPNVSTQIQLITPAEVQPGEEFRVISLITNNSTQPNNIANLVPTLTNNATLTAINGPFPSNISTLPQGNTAAFTWTYAAPETFGGVGFNASYTNAPSTAFTTSNMTVALSAEAEAASTSQWSQAASRVGILLSGIPNPVEASGAGFLGKWGIGIINPLDRDVEIYSVGILAAVSDIFWLEPIGVEPTTGWRQAVLGSQDMIVWEGGDTPIVIPAKDVGQFRVLTEFKVQSTKESLVIIQALTSEGKLNVVYTLSADPSHPLINAFYMNPVLIHPTPILPTSWGYLVKSIPSLKDNQIFNATIENAADNTLNSVVKMLILVPADFTDIIDVTNGTNGWNKATIVENPDHSHVIKVQTSSNSLSGGVYKTYQFSADAPFVNDVKLYVFQTTTLYPTFTGGTKIQTASALTEAGVEVIP